MKELIELVDEVTGLTVGSLPKETDLVKALGIDSLTGLRILAAVEKRYGIRFPDSELKRYRTLSAIDAFLKKEGVKET